MGTTETTRPVGGGEGEIADLGRTGAPTAAEPVAAPSSEIVVKFAQLGADPVEVHGPDGMTIDQGLAKAGINAGNMEIRVMREIARGDRKLANGETVLLIPRIRGGMEVEIIQIGMRKDDGSGLHLGDVVLLISDIRNDQAK